MMQGLKHAFEAGGWPMYVNLLMSTIVIAIIAERINMLFVKGRKLNKEHFMTQVSGLIVKGEFNRAITYCDAKSTPLSRICKAGLLVAPKSDEETQSAMDEASLKELPKLERRT